MLSLIRLCALTVLPLVALWSQPATARAQGLHWTDTRYHLDWQTATRVVRVERHTYAIHHLGCRPSGTMKRFTIQRSPHVREKVIYPACAPPPPQYATGHIGRVYTTGYQTSFFVTGYSWGCGVTGPMADRRAPYVGAVASNTLPFGTVVSIPSLGFRGVVEDTGAPLDILTPSCAATWNGIPVTGWRVVIVS